MNRIEAAELLEERLASLQELLEMQTDLLDYAAYQGEDVADLTRIVKAAKEMIAQNEETAKLIRSTAK